MDQVISKNIGAVVTDRIASQSLSWTAAGTGDNTTKTGLAIDREAISGGVGSPPDSAVFSLLADATLASGATLSVAWTIQDSADNSNWATYGSNTTASTAFLTGPSGGGRVTGQSSFNVNLSSARRYVRANFVPDLSAAGTDTAVAIAVATLAGYDRLASPS